MDRERKKGFAKILTLAKPMGLYVTLSQKNLYKNRLGYYSLVRGNKVLTGGDCEKIIEYLENQYYTAKIEELTEENEKINAFLKANRLFNGGKG